MYQAFLGDWHVRYDRVWDEAYEIAETPLPEDFLAPLYRLVTDIQLFGSPESSRLAEAAFQALMKFSGASRAKAAEHETTTDAAIAKYVEQVRRDLGIV